jgi:hypothetical protein
VTLETLASARRLGPLGRLLIVAIVLADVAMIGANLVFLTVDEPHREPTHPVFSSIQWNGDVDNSWMERVGQVQLIGATAACIALRARHGDAVYLVTAGLLAWIVIDDSAGLHERAGSLFYELGVAPIAGVRPGQLGELTVWAIAGLVFLGLYVWALRRASPLAAQRTWSVLIGFAVLLLFAMGVDTVNNVIKPYAGSWVLTGMALLENVGELVAVSLITVLVLVQVAGVDGRREPPARITASVTARSPV